MPTCLRFAVAVALILASHGITVAQAPKHKPVINWNRDRIAFDLHGKSWKTVLEWFAEKTGMPFRSKYSPPAGTFNFFPPKDPKTGKPREYTLAEIYDIINEFLQAEAKFTLLRLDSRLTIVPADGKDVNLIERVKPADLPNLSGTDIVAMVITVKGDDMTAEIKRMLGPFGQCTPLPVLGNQYIVQGDVKSLRLLLEVFPQPPPQKESPRPDWSKTRVAFDKRGKSWHQVIEWFVDQTGTPFRSSYPPPNGTFNFIAPKDPKTGKPREYTLLEIYDIINEFLQAEKKLMLHRTETGLTLLPADEPIPPKLLRRVLVSELGQCGRTEIVAVFVPLPRGLSTDEWIPKLRYGRATPLVSNAYILQGDVRSIVQSLAELKEIERKVLALPSPPLAAQSPSPAPACACVPRCRGRLIARWLRRRA